MDVDIRLDADEEETPATGDEGSTGANTGVEEDTADVEGVTSVSPVPDEMQLAEFGY